MQPDSVYSKLQLKLFTCSIDITIVGNLKLVNEIYIKKIIMIKTFVKSYLQYLS